MKPLLFIDIEATGLDVASDRIVSLAAVELDLETGSRSTVICEFFNPEMMMSDEVIAIHGITNDEVVGCHTFRERAAQIHEVISRYHLAGYNLRNFDIPLLWEEFFRAGIVWDVSDTHVVDVSGIFRKKEPRDLAGALRFYCDAELFDAHEALNDAWATLDVFEAQRKRYSDIGGLPLADLAKYSHQDDRVDLQGKLIRNAAGQVCYGFGQHKDVPVCENMGYAYWMLEQTWIAESTKKVLREVITATQNQKDQNHDSL